VARLLNSLRQAGAHEHAAALLARDPAAHAALDNQYSPFDNRYSVASLLVSLREAGAHEQAAALAARAAAHAPLDNLEGVAYLLDHLRQTPLPEQAAALAARAAAHAPLDDPVGVASLLNSLRQAGAHEHAAALLARDPAAHAALDDPYRVADLLDGLRRADAHEQAAALDARLPAAGMFRLFRARRGAADQFPFGLFLEQNGSADQFRFGREADGTPAAPWGWEDLDLWLVLRQWRQAPPAQHGAGYPARRNGRLNPNNPPPSGCVSQPTPSSSHGCRQLPAGTDTVCPVSPKAANVRLSVLFGVNSAVFASFLRSMLRLCR
jgi:hypothetical protein